MQKITVQYFLYHFQDFYYDCNFLHYHLILQRLFLQSLHEAYQEDQLTETLKSFDIYKAKQQKIIN